MKKILVSACMLGMNCRYNGVVKANEDVMKLLSRDDLILIPVCPEQMGGLATPRTPSEISNNRVVNQDGIDVTDAYRRGAEDACRMADLYDCSCALLKERSPSCGSGEIYDGTFSHRIIEGDGITACMLKANGIPVYGESHIAELLKDIGS